MTSEGLIFKLEINWTFCIGISQEITGHEKKIIALWILLISGFHLCSHLNAFSSDSKSRKFVIKWQGLS